MRLLFMQVLKFGCVLALALNGSVVVVLAQEFPAKPVRIIVPYTAGGPTDFVMRSLQPRLQEQWRQTVVIENRPGASAMIGSEFVAKSAPDGYVLLLGTIQTHATNVVTVKKLPYDPLADFTPVTQIARTNWMLAAHPSVPAKTPKQLISLARVHPGKLTYGSSGMGGLSHLAFEMLAAEFGLRMVHSPYKGTGPAAMDTISGHIQLVMADLSTLLQHVKVGKLTAIAITAGP